MEKTPSAASTPESEWHETTIRIRYKDTDRMGVVYYGNYLTFFEVARSQFMRDLGIPYSRLENQGYLLVVIEAAATYHANVGYDDSVIIKSAVTELRKVRLRFDYRVYDQDHRLLVSGHTIHACLDTQQKPARIPGELTKLIRTRCGSWV